MTQSAKRLVLPKLTPGAVLPRGSEPGPARRKRRRKEELLSRRQETILALLFGLLGLAITGLAVANGEALGDLLVHGLKRPVSALPPSAE